MTVTAHHISTRSVKSPRRALVVLEAVIALNAIGGGVYGLAGANGVPRAWLAGSPFHSYLIPSLVLLVVVGGGMVVALVSMIVGTPHAAEVSIASGLVLLGWITVEVVVIPFSWLQPTFFVLALAVVKLGYLERRQSAGRPRVRSHGTAR